MTAARPVLFIQGAEAGTHDAWDVRLVESPGPCRCTPLPATHPTGHWAGSCSWRRRSSARVLARRGGRGDERPGVPQARVYRLPRRDHQLDDDRRDVASVISADTTRQALDGHRLTPVDALYSRNHGGG